MTVARARTFAQVNRSERSGGAAQNERPVGRALNRRLHGGAVSIQSISAICS
jgi:hypothetical protein